MKSAVEPVIKPCCKFLCCCSGNVMATYSSSIDSTSLPSLLWSIQNYHDKIFHHHSRIFHFDGTTEYFNVLHRHSCHIYALAHNNSVTVFTLQPSGQPSRLGNHQSTGLQQPSVVTGNIRTPPECCQ